MSVRLIALLLVLLGLQSGAFRDLGAGERWVFGADGQVAAVMSESRKPDTLPAAGESLLPTSSIPVGSAAAFAQPASLPLRINRVPAAHFRYSTGPPPA